MSDHGESDHFTIKKRKHEDVHVDFTPMIDCMFLLLMFNMIAYTIAGTSELDLPQAKFAKGHDTHEATTLVVWEGEGPPRIDIQSIQQENSKTNATLAEVKAALQQAVAAGKTQVVIKAERKVPMKNVMDVASKVGELDGTTMFFAVQHGH